MDSVVVDQLLTTTRAVRRKLDLERPVAIYATTDTFGPGRRQAVEDLTYLDTWGAPIPGQSSR